MKTLSILVAASMLSLNAIVGGGLKEHPSKYCTRMQSGKMVVMHAGKVLTADATLSNGTVVKPDGTVVKKDGTKTMLKSGQCIDNNGTVAAEETNTNK